MQMTEYKPKIVAFCCNWCSYAGADLAGNNRLNYPAEVKIREYLFEALLELRRYDEARTFMDSLPADDSYTAYLPEIWCGDLLLAHGNTDGAIAVWKTAL